MRAASRIGLMELAEQQFEATRVGALCLEVGKRDKDLVDDFYDLVEPDWWETEEPAVECPGWVVDEDTMRGFVAWCSEGGR
ncbi:MAG: hypothetical protein F4Z50_07850 [Gemmatimonadetes bacterium]|nr:hypothetical protein [Gemmatimonadota bacterium]MYD13951.1 hypothetical protein [Gemmatimonadota bacterium]